MELTPIEQILGRTTTMFQARHPKPQRLLQALDLLLLDVSTFITGTEAQFHPFNLYPLALACHNRHHQ